MTFKSRNSRYTNRFISHLMGFIEKYGLFDKDAELLITVSGGIDSIVLLYSIYQLQSYGYSNSVRVLHINHGTREGQLQEGKLVEDLCSYINIKFESVSLDGLTPHSNFEHKARVKRYDAFYEYAKANEKILLAHHIDDSFEWTMLQSLRSSSIEGLVGIPLVNRRVVRPLMCFTKEQITNFANLYDLPYLEDPTNEQIKYERNFIRNEVIPVFSDRYRKYLKHYVYRHNEIARRLGLHLRDKHQSSFHINYSKKSVLIFNNSPIMDLSGLEELVIKAVKYLNPESRGSLHGQLEKVKIALKNSKTGPLTLSGNIKVYMDFNLLLILKDETTKELKEGQVKTFTFDQYTQELNQLFLDKTKQLAFPFLIKIHRGSLDKRRFDTSFNKKAAETLKAEDALYYPALKLLREWSKKRNRHRRYKLSFIL